MKCPICNSDDIQMQAKKGKNPILIGCLIFFGGLGLMFLGIIGIILGLIIGLIIGAIAKAILPTPVETIAVCQNCGNTFSPSSQPYSKYQTLSESYTHAFSANDSTEILVIRDKCSCGSAVTLNVWLNNSNPIPLLNGQSVILKANTGSNTFHYEQIQGVGKKKRTGYRNVNISEHSQFQIRLIFTSNGISISEGEK